MQQPQSSITQQQSSLSLTHQGYIVSVHIHTLWILKRAGYTLDKLLKRQCPVNVCVCVPT